MSVPTVSTDPLTGPRIRWMMKACWTLVVGALVAFALVGARLDGETEARALATARLEARAEVLRWASAHHAVYVPLETLSSETISSLPPESVARLEHGPSLVRLTPERVAGMIGSRPGGDGVGESRLISLRGDRQAEGPDPWEARAFAALNEDSETVAEVVEEEGGRFVRVLHALRAEQSCLRCHGGLGMARGDLIGAITLRAPVEERDSAIGYWAPFLGGGFLLLWLLGLGGMVFFDRYVDRRSRERRREFERLSESEKRLELALAGAETGLWDWNIRSGEIIVNHCWAEMLGYTAKEIGPFLKYRERLIHPDDAPWKQRLLDSHLAGETSVYRAEYRMRHRQGHWIWVLDTGQIVEWDEEGRPLRATGTHVDITARKKMEENLRVSSRQRQVIAVLGAMALDRSEPAEVMHTACKEIADALEASFASILLFETVERSLTLAADWSCSERFGGALLGVDPPDAVIEFALRQGESIVVNDLREEQRFEPPEALVESGIVSGLTVPCTVGDETVGVVCVWSERPREYSRDQVLFLESVGRLISLALLGKRMAAENERLAQAIENADDVVAITNCEGELAYVNPAFERTTGFSRAEVIGKNPRILASGAHDESFYREMWGSLLRGETWDGRFKNRRKDGTNYIEHATISPIRDADGQIVSFVKVGRDITREVELEAQLQQSQKLESIGQLAAGIAHEINTPTQFISDNTRFLKDSFADLEGLFRKLRQACAAPGEDAAALAARMQEALEEADVEYLEQEIPQAIGQSLDGLERVSKIVKAMKEFSHPGSKEMAPVDLNRAIESTSTVARNEYKYVADLELDLDPELPHVVCEVGELNQVVLNMLINSAHAIADVLENRKEEKGRIVVRTRREGEMARIEISDTGAGIAEENIGRIFEHFYTTKEVGKGTGQGLAIAHSVIVKKHHGTIDVESKLGEGTTFIIRLPIAVAVSA